jgi:hypothetical protein
LNCSDTELNAAGAHGTEHSSFGSKPTIPQPDRRFTQSKASIVRFDFSLNSCTPKTPSRAFLNSRQHSAAAAAAAAAACHLCFLLGDANSNVTNIKAFTIAAELISVSER